MMRVCYYYRLFLFLFITSLASIATAQDADEDAVFFWSSTGGGWRAMVACMGFANLFGQAGLLPMTTTTSTDATTSGYQMLHAISTTSGASWFSTQFFFSQNFYARTMSDADTLGTLVEDWFAAYVDLSGEIEAQNYDCLLPSDLPDWEGSEFAKQLQLCDTMIHFGNEWAAFIEGMLNRSAVQAYQDNQYATLEATPGNRVSALSRTRLLVHTTLVPQTRLLRNASGLVGFAEDDFLFNLGPPLATDGSPNLKYSAVIPVTYIVDPDVDPTVGTWHVSGGAPLQVHQEDTSSFYSQDDFVDYGLYPNNVSLLIPTATYSTSLGAMNMAWFGGKTKTVQAAAISSAAAGGVSPAAPSTFAQVTSQAIAQYNPSETDLLGISATLEALYNSDTVTGTAVCTQWPNACGKTDGRFIDGAYSDNPAVVDNIAHWQSQASAADLTSKKLKIVLSNTNQIATDTAGKMAGATQFLKYFKTDANANVAPGDYAWITTNPFGSAQIFEEYLSYEAYENLTESIPGSNFTTRILKGTTINNPWWGVKAGQSVEILLISTNSIVPIMIVGSLEAQQNTQPLADMAKDLATNTVLLQRVQTFFGKQTTATSQPNKPTAASPGTPGVPSMGDRIRRVVVVIDRCYGSGVCLLCVVCGLWCGRGHGGADNQYILDRRNGNKLGKMIKA